MTRVLVCHPGHGHSTSDVFVSLCNGLTDAGAEVITFEWDRMLRPLTVLAIAAEEAGKIKAGHAEQVHQFAAWLASADVWGMLIEAEANAVIVVNGLLFPPSRAAQIAKIGIPVACYGTEAPYFEATELEMAPFYTHWFTQERTAVNRYRRVNARSFYLPMAYDARRHTRAGGSADAGDVTFIGGGYPERKALLEGVDWTGIDFTRHGTLWGLDLDAEQGQCDFARGTRYTEGAIPNEITAALHRSAKIALNLHRKMTFIEQRGEIAPGTAESLGPRAYEIPAVGGFMLCDDERPELWDVFGESAAAFKAWDSADLERQVRYWLAHPDERERRRQAQYEAVQPHHWGARAKTMLEYLID